MEKDLLGKPIKEQIEGASVNEFFLVRYVNAQTGNAEWLDVNGNVTTQRIAIEYALVLQILILLVV
jgi:hypothetical protein